MLRADLLFNGIIVSTKVSTENRKDFMASIQNIRIYRDKKRTHKNSAPSQNKFRCLCVGESESFSVLTGRFWVFMSSKRESFQLKTYKSSMSTSTRWYKRHLIRFGSFPSCDGAALKVSRNESIELKSPKEREEIAILTSGS